MCMSIAMILHIAIVSTRSIRADASKFLVLAWNLDASALPIQLATDNRIRSTENRQLMALLAL